MKANKKEKREETNKKREELECVGGVISRKITGAGTVCTYGVWLLWLLSIYISISIDNNNSNRWLCVCFFASQNNAI